MLITLQSHKEVLEFISKSNHSTENCTHEHNTRTPILSISPQTLASLSAHYSALYGQHPITIRTLLRRIRSFLGSQKKGGWRVWDTTFARHISLRESVVEYNERVDYRDKGKFRATVAETAVPTPGPLPLLASACPGWVCYAEKAQGDLLPHMSSVRSSQAIMGALAKSWYGRKAGKTPDEIYHVTAMPCYDKKLEASRSDFYSTVYSTRDTDCVLTTGELDLLLQDLGFQPYTPVEHEDETPTTDEDQVGSSPWPELIQHPGTSSGSYLTTIMESIALRHLNPTRVIVKEIRGSTDNVEYLLEDTITHEVIFKGAKCYGFRNLQNLVRKVGKETGLVKGGRAGGASKLSAAIAARRRKAKMANGGTTTPGTPGTPNAPVDSDAESVASVAKEEKKLDYVEVMACPGGCVNGGGQMKPLATGVRIDEEGYPRPMADEGVAEEGMRWSTKEWVAKVETVYWGLPTPPSSPKPDSGHLENDPSERTRMDQADHLSDAIVSQVVGDDPAQRWELLRTRFRKVEGDILGGGVTGVTHEAVKW